MASRSALSGSCERAFWFMNSLRRYSESPSGSSSTATGETNCRSVDRSMSAASLVLASSTPPQLSFSKSSTPPPPPSTASLPLHPLHSLFLPPLRRSSPREPSKPCREGSSGMRMIHHPIARRPWPPLRVTAGPAGFVDGLRKSQ